MPADPPAAPGAFSPTFLYTTMREQRMEFARELDKVNARVDRMDENGTRGVEKIAVEVAQLRKDITDHETLHDRQRQEQVNGRRWMVGTLVALTVPLYPLLGWMLTILAGKH